MVRISLLFIIFYIFFNFANIYSKDLKLIIPLYSCPSDNKGKIWETVEKYNLGENTLIIWGIICKEDNYVSALKKLKKQGIKNVAYIATNDSKRDLKEIKKRIKFYSKFPIDGFFFDETSNEKRAFIYNNKIFKMVKYLNSNYIVYFNSPYPEKSFLLKVNSDIVNIFENTFIEWYEYCDSFHINLKKKLQVSSIIHTTNISKLIKTLLFAKLRSIDYVFVTDRELDNLPSYYKKEVTFIKIINQMGKFIEVLYDKKIEF